MSAQPVVVVHCPPSSSFTHFDKFQFADKHARAYDVAYAGHDTWATPGIAFADYQRMQTRRHELFTARRYHVPSFVLNNSDFHKVLTAAIERRAYGNGKIMRAAVVHLSLAARLKKAEEHLRAREPHLLEVLDALCAEFVGLCNSRADDVRMRQLQTLIATVDGTIRISRTPSRIYVGICYGFWRTGADSIAIGAELGLSPCAVRQILRRVANVARSMGYAVEKITDRFERVRQKRRQAYEERREEKRKIREAKLLARVAEQAERARIRSATRQENARLVAKERPPRPKRQVTAERREEIKAAIKAANKARRDGYRAAGLCPRCGAMPEPGKAMCPACYHTQHEANAKYLAKKKALALSKG